MKLTVLKVKRLRRRGRYADVRNLYLQVSEAGTKSWVFMWKRDDVRYARGLGPVDALSLRDARELADQMRRELHARGDLPKGRDRRTVGAVTFGQMADALFEAMSPSWRHPKYHYQWRRTLQKHCAPLREKPVAEISTEDVLAVLTPLWSKVPVTASKTRARIEAVLDYAQARSHRSGENPARWRGHLAKLLPRPRGLVRHFNAMPYADLPGFMPKLQAVEGVGARALEFAILTAARSGEVRGMRWSEVDLTGKVWTVPAARMKGGREHRVPLSGRAVAILRKMEKLRVSEYVFPSYRDGHVLSDMTLMMALRRLGADVTVHGFRSSFRDWAGDTTPYPREICEAALAHEVGSATERAYRRGTAFEQRRALMDLWEVFCCTPSGGNVITIHRTM